MRRPNLTPGFDNLGRAEPGEADAHTHPTEDKSFWSVVLTVELANLAFSLDNLVVAVAVSDKLWAVLLGVFIGSLIMRFAISIAIIVVSLLYAHVKWLHVFDPVLIWLAEGLATFNEVINWALVPVIGLIKLPWRLYQLSRREPVPEPVDITPDSQPSTTNR